MQKALKKNLNKPMGFMVLVLVLLMGIVSVQITNLCAENMEFEVEKERLERQMQCEVDRNIELLAQKENLNSNEYIEKMARDKLGLIKPDEIVFINQN